jgi:hypothetical protein
MDVKGSFRIASVHVELGSGGRGPSRLLKKSAAWVETVNTTASNGVRTESNCGGK